MQSYLQMHSQFSLKLEDCAAMVRHLDECLAVLDRNHGKLTIDEIKIKSMLAVLRSEMGKAGKAATLTAPPFGV